MANKLNLSEIKAMFNNATVETLQLLDLELHAGTQQRLKPNTEGIEAYTEAMEAGEVENFPAIRVVRLTEGEKLKDGTELEKGALILADGFTRVAAAEKAAIESFKSEVVDGTLDDAIRFSWVANSMHGQKLDQKDYQALIRKIYLQDPKVKKGDLARGLGCSAKTVSKALGVVEEEFKGKAHNMFKGGFSDKEIAKEVHKTEQTVKNWRDAWTEEQQNPVDEPPKQINPMKLKFDEVLAMEDLDKQINLLEMLQARVDENRKKLNPEGTTEEPQEAPESPEVVEGEPTQADTPETPQEATEEQNDLPFDADLSEGDTVEGEAVELDCWAILGREREQVAGLANPKASLTRSVRTIKKEGKHSDEVIDAALAEALKLLAE